MRVLLVHNRYVYSGGEDQVFARERELLARGGHAVSEWTVENSAIQEMNRLDLAASTIWSRRSARAIEDRVKATNADVVHFHNVMPLISPAGYWAARKAGAAVVQTIHNYRLVCPGAYLFRDGKPCEQCVGRRVAWPAVQHACYQNSRVRSAAVATMVGTHAAIGTWSTAIDAYIALTEFARAKLVEGGFPEDLIHIKPNFFDPKPVGPAAARRGYLFVGRLSPEKGVDVLVDAWRRVAPDVELRIGGDGPELERLRARSADLPNVRWLGRLTQNQVADEMRNARALLLPSLWYEVFPLVILEAFAAELPVLCSDHGSLVSLVDEEVGKRITPGDPAAWAAAITELDRQPDVLEARGRCGRKVLEQRYTPQANLERLVEIYELAIARRLRDTRTTNTSARAT